MRPLDQEQMGYCVVMCVAAGLFCASLTLILCGGISSADWLDLPRPGDRSSLDNYLEHQRDQERLERSQRLWEEQVEQLLKRPCN